MSLYEIPKEEQRCDTCLESVQYQEQSFWQKVFKKNEPFKPYCKRTGKVINPEEDVCEHYRQML